MRVGSDVERKAHAVKTGHCVGRGLLKHRIPPTFNLQEDVILLDTQVVGGDASVLPTVDKLGHMDLQRAVFMNDIWVTTLDAGLNIFEPW